MNENSQSVENEKTINLIYLAFDLPVQKEGDDESLCFVSRYIECLYSISWTVYHAWDDRDIEYSTHLR
jgi:hypothetical protein